MGFWDLISYGITIQLVLTVWTHVRRIMKPSALVSVLLCFCTSIFMHLIHLSFVGFFSKYSYYQNTQSSSSSSAEMVFASSPISICLLAFTFLLLIYVVEAATWLKTSFVPLIKSIKVFYLRLNNQKRTIEHSVEVQPPGIDLRGKVLKN